MRLDAKKRAELKALAEKATPGPYIPDNSLIHTARQREFMSADFPNHTDNAKFAAGAMNALPDALADIEELEGKLGEALSLVFGVREHEVRLHQNEDGTWPCSCAACSLHVRYRSKLADAVKALEAAFKFFQYNVEKFAVTPNDVCVGLRDMTQAALSKLK